MHCKWKRNSPQASHAEKHIHRLKTTKHSTHSHTRHPPDFLMGTCRLDDGGIIGHLGGNEAVKLSATQAQEQGRLTDADKKRITQLLSIAAGHAQISPPLVNGSKRRDSDGLEVL